MWQCYGQYVLHADKELENELFSRVHATLQPALSVGWSVGWLVGRSHFNFFKILSL